MLPPKRKSKVNWRKSSYSGSQEDTTCVELAALGGEAAGVVGIRDSTDPGGARLYLSAEVWGAVLVRLKDC